MFFSFLQGREGMMKKCYKCGTVWQGHNPQPNARETCSKCSAHMRCCRNCIHYIAGSSCTVNPFFAGDRTAANYCNEFNFPNAIYAAKLETEGQAKRTWDALFQR